MEKAKTWALIGGAAGAVLLWLLSHENMAQAATSSVVGAALGYAIGAVAYGLSRLGSK